MLIENGDALRSWMTKALTPIYDGEPNALVKYIFALVKKDKPEEELKKMCNDQLEVFLQTKTEEFINNLVDVIKTKKYLPPSGNGPPAVESNNSNTATSQSKPDTVRRSSKTDETTTEDRKRKSRSKSPLKDRDDRKVPRRFDDRRADSRDRRQNRPWYNSRHDVDYRRGRRSPNRSKSRSRSRSRGRFRSRSRSPRARSPRFRSRSPRKSRSPRSRVSPRPRSRSPRARSRSPRGRSFSPRKSWSPRRRSRTRTRSRSRTPEKAVDSRGSTPLADDRDYRTSDPAVSSTVVAPFNSSGSKPRCRDYDEMGYCMRGGSCPFDHGTDPVVLNENALGQVLSIPGGPPPSGPPGSMPLPGGPPPHNVPPPPHNVPPPPHNVPPPPHNVPPPPHSVPPPTHVGPPPPIHSAPPPLPPHGGPPLPGGPMRPMHGPPRMNQRPPQGPPPMRGPGPLGPGGPPPHHMPRPNYPPPGPRPMTPPPPGTVPVKSQLPPRPPVSEGFQPEPYNPEVPLIRGPNSGGYWPSPEKTGASGPGPQHNAPFAGQGPPSQHGRGALVSIPTVEDGNRGMQLEVRSSENSNRTVIASNPQNDRPHFQHGRKHGFDYSRLGGKKSNFDPTNTTLELRKVPRELNNIAKLNEHFSKFGNIVNLQISYGGDPEAALVTFQTRPQAMACYRNPEPVFNNRFIKLFWHNKDKGEERPEADTSSGDMAPHKPSVKERLGIPPAHKMQLNNTAKNKAAAALESADKSLVVTNTKGGLTKTVFNPAALSAAKSGQPVVARLGAKPVVNRKPDQKKEVFRKNLEIQKQKQILLEKQLEQQKILLKKIEDNKNMSAEDKATVIKTIKLLAGSIDRLEKELKSSASAVKPAKPVVKIQSPPETPTGEEPQPKTQLSPGSRTKQQAQKEILDAELELMNKQNAGVDTSSLRAKVAELKREATSLGLLGRRGRGRFGPFARNRGRGRGRGGRIMGPTLSVDHRPRTLEITGFGVEQTEEVVQYFSQHGELESSSCDESVPSLSIAFKTRQQAEQAAVKSASFPGAPLTISWKRSNPTSSNEEKKDIQAEDKESESLDQENFEDAEESSKTVAEVLDEVEDEEDVLEVPGNQEEEEEEKPVGIHVHHEVDDVEDVDEDVLLGIDEEEDEDDESRSWRR